jgi:hypothetical protein
VTSNTYSRRKQAIVFILESVFFISLAASEGSQQYANIVLSSIYISVRAFGSRTLAAGQSAIPRPRARLLLAGLTCGKLEKR